MSSWGVVFDWDGVIVDSSAQHEASWERMAEEAGLQLPGDHFQRGFGMKNQTIISELLRWTEDPAQVQRLSDRKEELYRTIIQERGMVLLPGVTSVLESLRRASIPCVVASSTPRINITCVLESLRLQDAFSALIAAEDVTDGKPDPEVFLVAAKAIRIPAGRCVVFEDTPVGIQAGRAAGMKVVAVATTHPSTMLGGSDRLVQRMDEVTIDQLAEWFPDP